MIQDQVRRNIYSIDNKATKLSINTEILFVRGKYDTCIMMLGFITFRLRYIELKCYLFMKQHKNFFKDM